MLNTSLYFAASEAVNHDMVKTFLAQQAAERLYLESTTLEFKVSLTKTNVVEAICALANTSGGLVLLGVDEKDPAKMPGVLVSEHDRLVNQLVELIEPYVMPEIVPVPADDPSKVVLVIRVPGDLAASRPFMCRGITYVRLPGRTNRASRDQVLALTNTLASKTVSAYPGVVTDLRGLYLPESQSFAENEVAPPDLRLRAAGEVWLRPEVLQRPPLSTHLRRALEAAVDGSDLAVWATSSSPRAEACRWAPTVTQEIRWSAGRSTPRRWEPRVDLTIDVRLHANRLAFSVDVDITEKEYPPSNGIRGRAIMDSAQLVNGMRAAAHLVTHTFPDVVADVHRQPPQRLGQFALWAMPARRDLNVVLGFHRYHRELTDNGLTSVIEIELDVEADINANRIENALIRALLNDSVHDAERIAEGVMLAARNRPIDEPWY